MTAHYARVIKIHFLGFVIKSIYANRMKAIGTDTFFTTRAFKLVKNIVFETHRTFVVFHLDYLIIRYYYIQRYS